MALSELEHQLRKRFAEHGSILNNTTIPWSEKVSRAYQPPDDKGDEKAWRDRTQAQKDLDFLAFCKEVGMPIPKETWMDFEAIEPPILIPTPIYEKPLPEQQKICKRSDGTVFMKRSKNPRNWSKYEEKTGKKIKPWKKF